jgi:hypothetical protein
MTRRLNYVYDKAKDVMEIEGIRYPGEFFRQFGHKMPLDTPLKITSRDPLTIVEIEPGDPDWLGDSERLIPEGMTGFFVPRDAPVEVVAKSLRELADRMEKDAGTPAPIVMPAGHA